MRSNNVWVLVGMIAALLSFGLLLGICIGLAGKVIPPMMATPTLTATLAPSPTITVPPVVPTSTPLPTATLTPTPTPTPRPKRLDAAGHVLNAVDVQTMSAFLLFSAPGASGRIASGAWSKDGQKVLVSYNWQLSVSDNGSALVLVEFTPTGTQEKEIVRATAATHGAQAMRVYGDAIWSPRGDRIAVRYERGGDYGIWLMNLDGSGFKRLDKSEAGDWPRYWSEDGVYVIAVSSADSQLYAVAVERPERRPYREMGIVPVIDQRFYPWSVPYGNIPTAPRCFLPVDWHRLGGAYWSCQ